MFRERFGSLRCRFFWRKSKKIGAGAVGKVSTTHHSRYGAVEMLVDWKVVEREFDHDQAKEFLHNILNNMEREFVAAYAQDFLKSISSQTMPLNKSLFLLKNLLLATPKYALMTLNPPSTFQDWLLAIIKDTVNVTSSLRCVGLSIVSILTKNMRKDVLKLQEIGNAITCSVLNACFCLSSSPGEESFQFGRLLLRQCVDNLYSIADESSPWLQSIGHCVFDVSLLIRHISTFPPNFQGSGQFLVDLSKLFNKVVSIWFAQCQSPMESGFQSFQLRHPQTPLPDVGSLFRSLPELIFQLIDSQRSLVHDSFQTAFYSALELSYRNNSLALDQDLLSSLTGEVAKRWVDRISQAIDVILGSDLPNSDDQFSTFFMDLGRLESLLLLLNSLFALRKELTKGFDKSAGAPAPLEIPWIASADLAFALITHTMTRLKSLMGLVPPKKQKMFKSLASNGRKASIALAETVLASCPLYLKYSAVPGIQQRFISDQFITSFCLKTLSTPSLFPQVYRSLRTPTQLIFEAAAAATAEVQPEAADSASLIRSLTAHLHSGLRQISQYSMAAGIDLIATLDELANADCVEIISGNGFDSTVNLPLSTILAYTQHPKVSPSSSSSSTEIAEWKSHCLSCLLSIFELYKSHPSVPCDSSVLRTFAESIPRDIILLHQCLGNISSGSLTSNTPSAREKLRKDALAASAASFHTTNTEDLIPLLQNLVELNNKLFDVISPLSSDSTPTAPLPTEVTNPLLELFSFLLEISLRSLLFEDDCSLLCSEIDLMAKIVSLSVEGRLEGQATAAAEVLRDPFVAKLHELETRMTERSEYITDEAQVKTIKDICRLHREKFAMVSSR
jgi:hypothetical protein